MSGVAPVHLPAGSQPSLVRGPHSYQPHRSSLEEHGMHEKGRHMDNYNMDHGYQREGPPHHFNSSTHQQHGSSATGSHHNGGGGSQLGPGQLGPGIMHAGGSHHNGGTTNHHHAMMGPLSDAEFNFSSTHHLHRANHGRGNFIDYDNTVVEPEMEKMELCAVLLTFLSYALIFATIPFSLFFSIKVVQEYERAVIFRLGRLVTGGARGPGIFFIIPCIDTYTKVDLRTVSFDVPPQEILSKDSVTVAVDAVVYFRISNAIASVSNVEDYARSTRLLAATTLRNVLGTKNLSEILSERESISHMIQTSLDEATDSWGVKVERVEIKDVRLPVQLQRAMAAEAEAAREARAKVIAAEGEQRASKALREASEVISDSPAALQLRYLQTLNSIAAEKNSTIVFPVPMELFRGIMMPNNTSHCASSSSSSSSSARSTPLNAINSKSSPPSPSSHHPHNPGHDSHHHHSHHHHSHHSSHHYRHHSGNANIVTTTASVLQSNPLNSRVTVNRPRPADANHPTTNIDFHHSYFPTEAELDQQLLVQQANSSSTTNNSKGFGDTVTTNSTVVVRKHSRTKADRLLYDMVKSGAKLATDDDLANESLSSFPGFPAPANQAASAPAAGSNGAPTANNNGTTEITSQYFLETECCNGPNRDNLHLNGRSSSVLNETDDHSFPNQLNAYNSGQSDNDLAMEQCCDISEFTE